MFPPQSTPSKRPKRRVESYRIYKRPNSADSQCSRPSPSSYEKATHDKLVGPTLSTPRGDKYYNQYRPLCEECPRDRGKVVGTLQGHPRSVSTEFHGIGRGSSDCKNTKSLQRCSRTFHNMSISSGA